MNSGQDIEDTAHKQRISDTMRPRRVCTDSKLRSRTEAVNERRIYCAWRFRQGAQQTLVFKMATELKINHKSKFEYHPCTSMYHISSGEDAWLNKHTCATQPLLFRHTQSHAAVHRPPLPTPPPFLPSSLRLSPFSLGELVFGFSYFPEVFLLSPSLPCFHVTLLSIFTLRTGEQGAGERRAAYSCQTASVLQLLSGSCDTDDAAEGFWCPANSAIFCPYPAWSVRQWWTASVSQRRCWVGENETGGGAPAETLYDALVIRCRLVLLVSRGAQWEQSLPLSAAPSWWQASRGRQMPTQCP